MRYVASFLFHAEPVAILAFIRSVLYVGVLFGFNLSEEQIAGIVLVVETFFAIFTRSKVSPA